MTIFKRAFILLPLSLLAASNPLYASEAEHEQHGAHVHGEAQLLIALEGDTLEIELHTPAMNIVGFEHQPKTKAQHEAVETAIDTLKQPDLLFHLPATAKCHSAEIEVDSPLTKHHEHDHAHQHSHSAETHSDFTAHYRYRCDEITQLKRIEVELFNRFPATERLEVQSISLKGQQVVDLTPGHNTFEL
jgi:hypothetical protein